MLNYKEAIKEIYDKAIKIAEAKGIIDENYYAFDHVEINEDEVEVVYEEMYDGTCDQRWVSVNFDEFDKSIENIIYEAEKKRIAKEQKERIVKETENIRKAEQKLKDEIALYEKLKLKFD